MTVVEELREEVKRLTATLFTVGATRDAAVALLREAPAHKAMPADHRYWNWSKRRVAFLDGLEAPPPAPAA